MASKIFPPVFLFKRGYFFISRSKSLCCWSQDSVCYSHFTRLKLTKSVKAQTREMGKRSGASDNGQLTLLKLKPKTVTAHPRSKRRNKNNRAMFQHQDDPDYFDDIDISHDDYEDLANTINTYGSNRFSGLEANGRYWREALAFQHFIRAKTLERKYFRPPQKLNLLTYAAKEQMRLLHQLDPAEWTVDVLSQVFPVGKESIQKILKSKVRLRRPQDILQNDLLVKRNWDNILSQLKKNNSDCENVLKDFLENLDGINIIQNALPSPDLPVPKIPGKACRGVFSLIVKDELDKQEEETEMLHAKQEHLNTMLSEVLKEIKGILEEQNKQDKRNVKYNSLVQDNPSENLKTFSMSRFQDVSFDDTLSKLDLDSERTDVDPIKHRRMPQKISLLSKKDKHGTYTYCIDDCVYDENGEFLYRLP